MEKIKELVTLLLAAFDVNNLDEIIANCNKAYTHTETFIAENDLSWLPDQSPNNVLSFALPGEITYWMIYGDKIEGIHEKLADQLEDDFPAFPFEKDFTSSAYFTWLDEQLMEKSTHLELIEIGNNFSDELQLLFVRRADTNSILALTQELHIKCGRAVDVALANF